MARNEYREETDYLNGTVVSAELVSRDGNEETEAERVLEIVLTYIDGEQRPLTAGSCSCCGGAEWNPIGVGDMHLETHTPTRAN